tara:strand:- start:333 stop:500 length:168 start_codon:yes stop_codon:yes gene_type:complete
MKNNSEIIKNFQAAMKKVAPVSKILGISLEETAATLSVLTDICIKERIKKLKDEH